MILLALFPLLIPHFSLVQKGQLGRPPPEDEKLKERKAMWFAIPGTVPGIGKNIDLSRQPLLT